MRSKTVSRYACALAAAMLLAAGAGLAQQPANVAGKWQMSWEGPQGPVTSQLTLEQDGEKLKGTLTGQRGESPLTGSVKGKNVSFTIKRETPRGEFTVEYTGTVDGDTMKGSSQMGQRTIEWTAKREKAK